MRKTTVLIVFLILFSFSLCFQAADEETLSNIEGNYNTLVLFFADSFLRIDTDQKIDRWLSTDDGQMFNFPFYRYTLKKDGRLGVDKDYTNYESIKQYYLSIATPYVVMQLFAAPEIINVNGLLYMQELEGGTSELGGFDQWEILKETDDYLEVKGSLYTFDGINQGYDTEIFLLVTQTYELRKIDGAWKISRFDDHDVSPVFQKYINNVIKGYVFTENVNCGYKKFRDKTDAYGWLDGIDIVKTDYNENNGFCTGSAYAFLTEYDKNGKEASLHKITVEIGENLSEKITDTIVESYGGYDPKSNPLTDDFRTLIFAAPAVLSLSIILLQTRIHKKDY